MVVNTLHTHTLFLPTSRAYVNNESVRMIGGVVIQLDERVWKGELVTELDQIFPSSS